MVLTLDTGGRTVAYDDAHDTALMERTESAAVGKKTTKPGDKKRPNRTKVPLGTELEPWLRDAIDTAAEREQRKLNVLVSRALVLYLSQEHPDLLPPGKGATQPAH